MKQLKLSQSDTKKEIKITVYRVLKCQCLSLWYRNIYAVHLRQLSKGSHQKKNFQILDIVSGAAKPRLVQSSFLRKVCILGWLQKGLPAERPPVKRPPWKRPPPKKPPAERPTIWKRPPPNFFIDLHFTNLFLSLYVKKIFLAKLFLYISSIVLSWGKIFEFILIFQNIVKHMFVIGLINLQILDFEIDFENDLFF